MDHQKQAHHRSIMAFNGMEEVALQIKHEIDQKIGPEKRIGLIPVLRGGLFLSMFLSHLPNASIRGVITTTDGKFEFHPANVFKMDVTIIVEDIVDTGETVVRLLEENLLSTDDLVASLCSKVRGEGILTQHGIELISGIKEIPDSTWVEFPWEK